MWKTSMIKIRSVTLYLKSPFISWTKDMANNELINYIKDAFASGQSIPDIRTALETAGYHDTDITVAIVASSISTPQLNVNATPAQVDATPLPKQTNEEPTHSTSFVSSKKKSIWIALGAILFILLFGGSVFAYVSIPKSSSSGTALLYEAIANQKNVYTMHVQSNIAIKISSQDTSTTSSAQSNKTYPDTGSIIGTISSIVDTRDASSTNIDSNISINIDPQYKYPSTSVKLHILQIGDTMYVKLLNITSDLIPSQVQQFLNKWFSIKTKELISASEGFAQQRYSQFDKKQNTQQQIDSAQRVRSDIDSLSMKSRIFVVSKDLGADTVGSVSTYHYKLSIDTKAADAFFYSALQIMRKDMPSTPITDNEIVNLKDAFKSAIVILNQPNMADMEVWISKDTHRIMKISLTVALTKKVLLSINGLSPDIRDAVTSAPENNNDTLLLSFDSVLTDQNIPVNITAPLQSSSLVQFLTNVVMQSMSGARGKDNTAAIQGSLNSVITSGELYYSSNNNYGATRSSVHKGVCAYPSVSNSLQNIRQITGNKPVCTTNAKSYSPASSFTTYTQLKNGHYLCIDNSNNFIDIGTSLSSYRAGISCQ